MRWRLAVGLTAWLIAVVAAQVPDGTQVPDSTALPTAAVVVPDSTALPSAAVVVPDSTASPMAAVVAPAVTPSVALASQASGNGNGNGQIDAMLSPSIVGTTTSCSDPAPQGPYKEHNKKVKAMPQFAPVSYQELRASGTPGKIRSYYSIAPDDLPMPASVRPHPQASGTGGASYADSRFGSDYTSMAQKRVGKLLMRKSTRWWMCSGAVFGKALVVTAAHCVFQYGQKDSGWPDVSPAVYGSQLQVTFQPGLDAAANPSSPYGTWWAKAVTVPAPYFYGNDSSDANSTGIAVNNDIALVWMLPNNNGQQIGDVVGGWFGYGYDGFGFSTPVVAWNMPTGAPATAQVKTLGYPYAFDGGKRMQCSDGAAYFMKNNNTNLKNMIKGSALSGGASGGPWICNYGIDATLNNITYGTTGTTNRAIIIGVSSWSQGGDVKAIGASCFGKNKEFPNQYGTRGWGNIAKLMWDACDSTATNAWGMAAKGLCP